MRANECFPLLVSDHSQVSRCSSQSSIRCLGKRPNAKPALLSFSDSIQVCSGVCLALHCSGKNRDSRATRSATESRQIEQHFPLCGTELHAQSIRLWHRKVYDKRQCWHSSPVLARRLVLRSEELALAITVKKPGYFVDWARVESGGGIH
jgi:hypothetical protein